MMEVSTMDWVSINKILNAMKHFVQEANTGVQYNTMFSVSEDDSIFQTIRTVSKYIGSVCKYYDIDVTCISFDVAAQLCGSIANEIHMMDYNAVYNIEDYHPEEYFTHQDKVAVAGSIASLMDIRSRFGGVDKKLAEKLDFLIAYWCEITRYPEHENRK